MNKEAVDEEFMDRKESMDEEELDADILVESLSELVSLTSLHLLGAETLRDQHIMRLTGCLPKLEVWSTIGYWLTDGIRDKIAFLKSLHTLDLDGVAVFTADGVLGFIENSGPGNKGLDFSVENFDKIWSNKRELIEQMVTEKVKGCFDFTLVTGGYRHN